VRHRAKNGLVGEMVQVWDVQLAEVKKDTMPEVVAKTVHGSKVDKCRSIDDYLKEVFLILYFVKPIK
jgi:Ran GTPase-activating protein (RanGAP) involved in mRNA processing and transport